MHPQTVVAGYRLARDAAMASLEKVRTAPSPPPHCPLAPTTSVLPLLPLNCP